MAIYDGRKNLAPRQQQPIIGSLLIVVSALLLVTAHGAADLHSPALFLFKAGLQPITLIALLAALIFALWSKRKITALSVGFACLINLPFLLPNLAHKARLDLSVEKQLLSVATFSTLTRTQNIPDILKFIESEQPDLFCLQEVSQLDQQLLLTELNSHYRYYAQSNNNQLTLSHYDLALKDDAGHTQVSELNHPDWGSISVINAHMPRPYLSNELFASWEQLFQLIDQGSKIVLCGDLNITPNNSLYDVLNYDHGLSDALNSGYGFTFPNGQRKSSLLGPLIRIDYILTRGFRARNTRTVNASKLSDHRAVVTELTLTK